jgi:hypothetical protein
MSGGVKPEGCPFCGNAPRVALASEPSPGLEWLVECVTDDCPGGRWYDASESKCIAVWNRRAPAAAAPIAAQPEFCAHVTSPGGDIIGSVVCGKPMPCWTHGKPIAAQPGAGEGADDAERRAVHVRQLYFNEPGAVRPCFTGIVADEIHAAVRAAEERVRAECEAERSRLDEARRSAVAEGDRLWVENRRMADQLAHRHVNSEVEAVRALVDALASEVIHEPGGGSRWANNVVAHLMDYLTARTELETSDPTTKERT